MRSVRKAITVTAAEAQVLGSIRETPSRGTLVDLTYGSLNRELTERVYIPRGPLILTPTRVLVGGVSNSG